MDYKNLNDYEMVYRIRECDEDAVNIMYEKYEPVIRGIASKYYLLVKHNGADMSDLIQEGRIALCKALSHYDMDKDAVFYTYVSICIHRQLITYCRGLTAVKNMPLNCSTDDECLYVVGDNSMEPSSYAIERYEEEMFIKNKFLFDFKDSNIFELRYNGFSYREISELLDLSFSTVDSRLCKIRRTLQRMENKF